MTAFFPILTSRVVALRADKMDTLARHPLIATLDDQQVCLVEAFRRYLRENVVSKLDRDYVRGFAMVADLSPEALSRLSAAMAGFGMSAASIFEDVVEEMRLTRDLKRVHKGPKRAYEWTVSLPPEELPVEWQDALAQMNNGFTCGIEAPAPSIRTRLQNRLCMFAWSARRAGRPIDLGDQEALQAFFRDLHDRSAAKYESVPREATLRNSFEELHRFARYIRAPEPVISALRVTYDLLCISEGLQDQLKWKKIEDQSSELVLTEARDRLERSRTASTIAERQRLRNQALALIVGFYVVPRPVDYLHFRFNESVFFDEARRAYTFIYIQQKTANRGGTRRTIKLPPSANEYMDAVILRDAPVDLLPTLREKVMHDKRPLTIHDNDEPVAYGWYSRVFVDVIGTGGHAMRALRASEIVHAFPNHLGLDTARKTVGHASPKSIAAYLSEKIAENSIHDAKMKARKGL